MWISDALARAFFDAGSPSHTLDTHTLLLRDRGRESIVEADTYADKLMAEGRGTEALAFRTFFSFIDRRDARAGARITDADITKAVDYASKSLLENKDVNGDGYSKRNARQQRVAETTALAFVDRPGDRGILV